MINSNNKIHLEKNIVLKQLLKEYENIKYQYKIRITPAALALSDTERTLGYWKSNERVIGISYKLISKYSWKSVVEVLKHEMAHQIADELLGGHNGHDETFHKACEMIFVETWARSANVELDASEPNLKALASNKNEKNPLERKIEKLLQLANSPNENEASLALAKANELRTKYQLDNLAPYSESDIYTLTLRTGKKRLENSYTYIVKILTSFFGVKAIFSSEFDPTKDSDFKTVELIGSAKDLVISEYVYSFLLKTVDSLWLEHKKKNLDNRKRLSLAARNAYRLGVLVGIHNKLKIEKSNKNKSKVKIFDRFKSFVTDQNTVSSPSDSPSQNLLILEEKNQKVLDKVFAKKFPKVTSSTSSFSGRNPGAFEAGRAAGGKINIYSAISPNSKVKYLTD